MDEEANKNAPVRQYWANHRFLLPRPFIFGGFSSYDETKRYIVSKPVFPQLLKHILREWRVPINAVCPKFKRFKLWVLGTGRPQQDFFSLLFLPFFLSLFFLWNMFVNFQNHICRRSLQPSLADGDSPLSTSEQTSLCLISPSTSVIASRNVRLEHHSISQTLLPTQECRTDGTESRIGDPIVGTRLRYETHRAILVSLMMEPYSISDHVTHSKAIMESTLALRSKSYRLEWELASVSVVSWGSSFSPRVDIDSLNPRTANTW